MNAYYEKYNKYKNKYIMLKKDLKGGKNLIGGAYALIIYKFLTQNKDNFITSEFYKYLIKKIEIEQKYKYDDTKYNEFIRLCIPYIIKLNEYLYSKLSLTSKAKETITIFSYGTGNGIVETLFSLYLNIEHKKMISIVYFDIIDVTQTLRNYGVYKNIFGFYQLGIEPHLMSLHFNLLLHDLKEGKDITKKGLFKKYLNFLDGTPILIDLFITNNPLGYKYTSDKEIFEIPEEYKESRRINNIRLEALFLYIKLVLSYNNLNKDEIPMLWIIWQNVNLDLDNFESTLKSLPELIDPKFYNINPEYAISTINNLNEILKIIKHNEIKNKYEYLSM